MFERKYYIVPRRTDAGRMPAYVSDDKFIAPGFGSWNVDFTGEFSQGVQNNLVAVRVDADSRTHDILAVDIGEAGQTYAELRATVTGRTTLRGGSLQDAMIATKADLETRKQRTIGHYFDSLMPEPRPLVVVRGGGGPSGWAWRGDIEWTWQQIHERFYKKPATYYDRWGTNRPMTAQKWFWQVCDFFGLDSNDRVRALEWLMPVAGGASLFTESFTGTNGDPFSSDWDSVIGDTSPAATIQSNRGRLDENGGDGDQSAVLVATAKIAARENGGILGTGLQSTNGSKGGICQRAQSLSGKTTGSHCYFARFQDQGATNHWFQRGRVINWIDIQDGQIDKDGGLTNMPANPADYRMDVFDNGTNTTLEISLWGGGRGAEPGTPDFNVTNADANLDGKTGQMGLFFWWSISDARNYDHDDLEFDDLAVGGGPTVDVRSHIIPAYMRVNA